jgi:hypothetical protein
MGKFVQRSNLDARRLAVLVKLGQQGWERARQRNSDVEQNGAATSREDSAVEPAKSENITVTWRRVRAHGRAQQVMATLLLRDLPPELMSTSAH